MSTTYDSIVVGAGIEGSCTAYHLAKNGFRTLLIEQFPLPHPRGSSHGFSRITRKSYKKDIYTKMMGEAFQLWDEIGKNIGEQLFRNNKVLSIGSKTLEELKQLPGRLTHYGVKHKVYKNSAELKRDYPMFNYDDGKMFVLDEDGGTLRADKCLSGVQALFTKHGGIIRDGEKVTDIIPGSLVTVKTCCQTYHAKNVVVCAGPWSGKLLKPLGLDLPLKPVLVDVVYWREKVPGSYTASKTPCVIQFDTDVGSGVGHVYGLPVDEYPDQFKFCYHGGVPVDPDQRDSDRHLNEPIIRSLQEYVARHFPLLEPKPSIIESCMYTWTPDGDFILCTHPQWKNVIIGAGFSGHGFKLGPVVGKILMELASNKPLSYDISHFAMSRFNKSKL